MNLVFVVLDVRTTAVALAHRFAPALGTEVGERNGIALSIHIQQLSVEVSNVARLPFTRIRVSGARSHSTWRIAWVMNRV